MTKTPSTTDTQDAESFPSIRAHHCLLLAACAFPVPAYGLDDGVLNPYVYIAQRYDSNLFRLPDGVEPFGSGRRSATTRTVGVGLQVNKTYGQQRFDVAASVSRDQYDPYDYLDATGRALTATWAWTLTPSLTGNLSFAQVEAPNNFADTGLQVASNKRKTEERRFDVAYRPGAALHPRLALIQSEDKSQQTTFQRQNSKTTSLEGALVYEFRSGNTAELYFRRGRGDYLDLNGDPLLQNDAQYDENETGIAVRWQGSGASRFDGRIGFLDRKHRTFASRDFSGPVGNLQYTYELTGKTRFQVSANRTLSSIQSFSSSYSRDESLSIGPTWFATGKITVRPLYTITRRTFRGALAIVTDDLTLTTRDASLNVDWSLLRSITLSLTVLRSNRSSNDAAFQYADHGAAIRGSLNF